MKKTAMTIAYAVGSNLYLNLTNRCPCACTFCIRTMGDTAYGSDPLWLEHEPSWEEVKAALDAVDVSAYHEVVFCGFGEPTERLELLCQTADYLKQERNVRCIRLNTMDFRICCTTGRRHRIYRERVDIVSISLNAGTEEAYLKVTRPIYKEAAFTALQQFAPSASSMSHR